MVKRVRLSEQQDEVYALVVIKFSLSGVKYILLVWEILWHSFKLSIKITDTMQTNIYGKLIETSPFFHWPLSIVWGDRMFKKSSLCSRRKLWRLYKIRLRPILLRLNYLAVFFFWKHRGRIVWLCLSSPGENKSFLLLKEKGCKFNLANRRMPEWFKIKCLNAWNWRRNLYYAK